MFSEGRDILTLFYTGYLTNGILDDGTKILHQLLNQNSLEHQISEIWCAGWCLPKIEQKTGFELMTSRPYFRKMMSLLR